MKIIHFLLFASIFLISCGSDNNINSTKSNVEKSSSSETLEEKNIVETNPLDSSEIVETEIDQEIVNQIPEELEETSGALKIDAKNSTDKTAKIEKTETTKKPIEKIKEPAATKEIIEVEQPKVKEQIHKTWDNLTRKYISSSGKVNYAGFKKEKIQLEKYIKELQSYHKDLSSWSKNKRLAYWINVYNAVTVKLIVDNYPLKSITDLHGGKPWDQKLINLGGVSYSLDVIENKIIRPRFNEPRIHFAVNCAAKSCPKILNRAWTEDNIQRYLTKQTKAFIANSSQNTIKEDKVILSKIFDWYKTDFGTSNENVIKFINKYSDIDVKSDASVSYNEYNWSLNN